LLRVFDPERDYETVSTWLAERGLRPIPLAILPKLGILAERDGVPAAAAWLYMDNSGSGVCFLEGTVTRPGITLRDARESVRAVVSFLKVRAAELGYSTMITFCNPVLAREARRSGFEECTKNLTMLSAGLCQQHS